MSWSHYAALGVLALLGSGHCASMCGGFALAAAGRAAGWGTLVRRQTVYQLGKATSYGFIGLLLLALVKGAQSVGWVADVQRALSYGLGAMMVIIGLAYATEWRWRGPWLRWLGADEKCGLTGLFSGHGGAGRAFVIGWMNGLLPCGLSLMALVYLLRFKSVWATVSGSLVFALGTMPALLLVAWLGQRISVESRRRWLRVGGVLLVIWGGLTAVRGIPGVHAWMHEWLVARFPEAWVALPAVDPWCE